MSLHKVDTIVPVTPGASLSLKGNNAGNPTANGLEVDANGDTIIGGVGKTDALSEKTTGAGIAITGSLDFSSYPNNRVNGTDNSRLLNDYEEGTWTPTFHFAGVNKGTHSSQVGVYSKIGSTVFLNAYIRLSSKGSAAGSDSITIVNIPFTSKNLASNFQYISVRANRGVTITSRLNGYTIPNTNIITLEYSNTSAGSATSVVASELGADVEMIISGFYFV